MNDHAPQICIDERLARLQRRVEREKKARSEAEALLEAKSRELYQANQRLVELAAGLEERVAERTRELLMEHERAVGLARDVVKSEKEIADQVQRLQAALANMPAGLSMFDSELRLIVCNDRYAELYGLPPDLVAPGTPLALLIGHNDRSGSDTPHDPEAQDKLVSEHLAKLAKREPYTYIQRLSDGRSVRVTVGPMTNGGWVDVHEDITERLLLEERVAHLALHDPLTGLPNRLLLRERLEQDLASTGSSGEVAVLCLDLDNFKEANDAFGHAFGDELLCAISRRLETAAQGAFTARVGGDEFTVVLPICARSPAAAALADRLLKAVSEEFEIRGQRVQVGLSVGGAISPRDGTGFTTLLGNADAALYRAKVDGRHAVRFFDRDIDTQQRERQSLQHDLRSAVANSEFLIHYQPQAKMDGVVFGFEALVRWEHPKLGIVSPATFIPLAERNGTIDAIGEWTLRQACREAASWAAPLQVAVNLSPVQFRYGDLANLVHQVLFETGLPPERLELEITEGVVISDPLRVLAILGRLKLLGVKIAMDDFGTGYASLSSLQSFPFDKIKIDRTFITNVDTCAQSAAIVRSVIGLGAALGIPIIAEGVETEGERAFLVQVGCREMQGYLVGRPEPIERYAELTGGSGHDHRPIVFGNRQAQG